MAKKERNYLKLLADDDTLDFGRLVAEKDDNLAHYYVSEQRYLRRALDIEDPATFFIGPKGMGKSAILKMVQLTNGSLDSKIINIRPDDLAFSALANVEATSPIIAESTKNQWLLKTLWDYVLAMEVLKLEFPNTAELSGWFSNLFRGQYEKEARKLIALSQGEDTSLTMRLLQLVKEVELSGEYGGAKVAGKVAIEAGTAKSAEPLHLLSLVNSVARKLRDNVKHSYYLLFDDLDLYWSDTPTQNAFLAALFTSLSHFSRPPKIKAVVALRENIYKALPLVDRDKLHDVVVPVRWDFESVRTIVEKRILFKLHVQQKEIWGGLFPEEAFKASNLETFERTSA